MINRIIFTAIMMVIIIMISRVLWSLVGKMGRKEAAFGRLLLHAACTICNPIIIVVVIIVFVVVVVVIVIIAIIIAVVAIVIIVAECIIGCGGCIISPLPRPWLLHIAGEDLRPLNIANQDRPQNIFGQINAIAYKSKKTLEYQASGLQIMETPARWTV